MEFLIVSGLSGAGKSQAANYLEDMDYFCVDNMPVALLKRFAEFCLEAGGRFERVALVTDIRSQSSFDELFQALDALKEQGCVCRILFMEAETNVIVRRYKETRRRHPLMKRGLSIQRAVEKERTLLESVRARADWIVSTNNTTLGQLYNELRRIFLPKDDRHELPVTVMSFGYKYGLPLEADLVFDVRFMPNPHYETELRPLTGLDSRVAAYALDNDDARAFLDRIAELINWLLPRYWEEGKSSLTVAIGCTGGRHRSVATANALTDRLLQQGHSAESFHRDCR